MTVSKHDKHHKALLNEASLKSTKARLGLLAILQRSKKPLAVEAVHRKFGADKPDMATVYRSLKDLLAVKLIRQVDLQHGHAHYEYVGDSNSDHHHIICTNCGLIEDITDCKVDPLIAKALQNSKRFTRATDHSFEIFGVCKTCST